LPKREGRTTPSRSEIDCIACVLLATQLANAGADVMIKRAK
jgi:hypothetical protein